jgi:hypothetical protein
MTRSVTLLTVNVTIHAARARKLTRARPHLKMSIRSSLNIWMIDMIHPKAKIVPTMPHTTPLALKCSKSRYVVAVVQNGKRAGRFL